MNSYKAKQYLIASVKVTIVIAACVFIYNRLIAGNGVPLVQVQTLLAGSGLVLFYNLLIVLLLSILNWGLEILKWQQLASTVTRPDITESTKQVLSAQALALLTPFKIGEYGTKALFYPKKQAKKIVFLNFLGNMSQLAATLFFGLFGLGIYFYRYYIEITGWYIFALLIIILAGYFFQKVKLHNKLLPKSYNLNKAKKVVRGFSISQKYTVLSLAFLRYAVFSFQFYFILNC